MPLGDERSWEEQTIETEGVVAALSAALALDFPLNRLTGQHGNDTAASHLSALARQLEQDRSSGDANRLSVRWDDLCEFLYAWDAKIQDSLAGDSFAVASGYQLGRGLAEIYWALEGSAPPDDPRSCTSLLGAGRLEQLTRLLASLSDYFTANAAAAVISSLGAWGRLVDDTAVRAVLSGAEEDLHRQIRLWHDMLLLGQRPSSRVESRALIAQGRRVWPVLRMFIPEAAVALLGFAAAAAAVGLFVAGNYTSVLAPILTMLGAFGITSAGVLAKAKSEALSLFSQLQQAMDAAAVEQAITLPPARAYLDAREGRLSRRAQRRERRALLALSQQSGQSEATTERPQPAG